MLKHTIYGMVLATQPDKDSYVQKELVKAGFDLEKSIRYEHDILKDTIYYEQDKEDPEEYDDLDDGKRMIYRTYNETEVASLWTFCKCPHCGHEQSELDMNDCGETYEITCENEQCEKEYKMYFDAS